MFIPDSAFNINSSKSHPITVSGSGPQVVPYITLIKHLYSTFKFVNPAKNFRVVRLHNVLGRNKGEDVEEIQQHFPVVVADAEEFHAELLHLAAERLLVVEPTATRLKQ